MKVSFRVFRTPDGGVLWEWQTFDMYLECEFVPEQNYLEWMCKTKHGYDHWESDVFVDLDYRGLCV